MNPALVLTYGNLELTKQCVESLRKQDIPVSIFAVDNGSKDETVEWFEAQEIPCMIFQENTGFSHGINKGLDWVFRAMNADYCLCPGSDTIMPPSYYRLLLDLNLPVVSGVQDIDGHRVTLEDLDKQFPVQPINPNPDFSCLLWRKEAWEKLGGLDESMVNYASDCDLHVRAHRLGIVMSHAQIPFFHYGSSTIKNAPPREKRQLDMQADADRLTFAQKWGFTVGSPQYAAQFSPEAFRCENK
jgi:GT2 family glycosyltransferase